MNLPPNRKSFSRAMTLIEVLVVAAIIGILFAIALPVISKLRTSASKAASASNLRQIGVAIQTYTGENDGRLPGPTKGGQYPIYGVSNSTRENLASYLAPYLNLPALTSGSAPAEIFAFPAYRTLYKVFDSAPSYFANQRVSEGAINYNPWGYARTAPAVSGSPVKVVSISNAGVSNTWALTEMDQQLSVLDPGSGWFARLPAKPFHGATRNTLFFDGSVGNFPNKD